DSSAVRNFTYYYYVTAVDEDGIESSHFVVRSNIGASPTTFTGRTLKDVRVVPNPFVFNSDGNYGAGAENRIVFAGLPGPCKITIYTLTGDIVYKIDLTENAGSYQWNSKTKYNQFITSGLYIYQVESTEGKGSKIGKFIVIR
ncbi:MAG: T9SS type A sorting domain-containing protein, partial [Flavobacteriaceae bacterium]|nr:T9SS type A sorting domain-containing protein [Flavobacteriaceae bacterium]